MVRAALVGVTLGVVACSSPSPSSTDDVGTGTSDESHTTEASDSAGQTSQTGESETGESETGDPPVDPCTKCSESEICFGFCYVSDFGEDQVTTECIENPACTENPQSPACVEAACTSPYARIGSLQCEGTTAVGSYEFLCWTNYWWEPCGQDGGGTDDLNDVCFVDTKCVPQLPDRWGLWPSDCRPVVGSDPVGSPCTSEGAAPSANGVDSCDGQGVCWNGALQSEPFAGTCLGYCTYFDFECPVGSTCQEVSTDFFLCVPTP
jgi:hypothetical protein